MVAGPIDREELSRYALTVRVEDPGGLSGVAQVAVRVLDVNDRDPEFADLPYIFRVKENDLTGYIGRVHVITIHLKSPTSFILYQFFRQRMLTSKGMGKLRIRCSQIQILLSTAKLAKSNRERLWTMKQKG